MKQMIAAVAFALLLFPQNKIFANTDLYFVEPMLCQGKMIKRPDEMRHDYTQILMKLTSVKSRQANGTFADSLVINNAYFKNDEAIDLNTQEFAEEWIVGPLRVTGDRIVYRNRVSGGDDNLRLKIGNSRKKGVEKIQELNGVYDVVESVYGTYTYEFKCQAAVVETPSAVIDRIEDDSDVD